VRVVHVDPERGWGGGEAQVAYLVRELGRRGHQNVLAAPAGAPLAARAAALGARVVDCPIANDVDLRAVPRLRRLAATADVVHFHTARAHALAPWLAGTRARRVVTRRMDYPPRGGWWTRHLYHRAVDGVIAISDGVRTALIGAGVDGARIRVVPSGVDAEDFVAPPGARERLRAEWGCGPGDRIVIVIGVLEARKGHAVLFDALRRLPDVGGVRCVVAGDGALATELEERARGLPIRFLGFRSDVAACLAAADVAVLPSLHEGLGIAALESMAAGRPLVATRVGGLAEVVEDGASGLLVPPGDAAALAAALARLLDDPALAARLAAAAAARVRAKFSVAAMAEGTLACYGGAP
jgi:glycosyltransferase involved in cell wall biosynthesis